MDPAYYSNNRITSRIARAFCLVGFVALLVGCTSENADPRNGSFEEARVLFSERLATRISTVVHDTLSLSAVDLSSSESDSLDVGDWRPVCEPVSQNLLDAMRSQFGTPTRAVQVEVGEGLEPGENWWIVVLDSPADDSYKWGIRAFLTNAPGVSSKDEWKWIIIDIDSDDPWRNVSWDGQRLARAQSALDVALDYLGASSHE